MDRYGVAVAALYVVCLFVDVYFMRSSQYFIVHKLSVFLGVFSFLYLTKYILACARAKRVLIRLGMCSFFVFAAHEPLLTVLKKLSYKFIEPISTYCVLGLYFMIPMVVIVFLIVFYNVVITRFPLLVRVAITGGR